VLLIQPRPQTDLDATQPDILEHFDIVTSRIAVPPVDEHINEVIWRALHIVNTLPLAGGLVHSSTACTLPRKRIVTLMDRVTASRGSVHATSRAWPRGDLPSDDFIKSYD
jgi:hypothetical protein